ncbi:MAG: response regulator [Deltaproteobacteria bacterium]|nr:response regulator [Deltaproteobacteria bacterium]
MKILIVDDSKAMRMIVSRNIRQSGIEISELKEAGNGKEALAVMENWTPDLILSDWNMPEMSGIEFLQKMNEREIKIKFGFVTAEGTAEMKKLAFDTGALFLIAKPFTPEAFKQNLLALR